MDPIKYHTHMQAFLPIPEATPEISEIAFSSFNNTLSISSMLALQFCEHKPHKGPCPANI